MPMPHSPDITMHELEQVGEACGRFAELLEDLLMPDDGLLRHCEKELPITGGELRELSQLLGIDDLLLKAGDRIGACEYNQFWDWQAISDDEDTAGIGKLSLMCANSFLIPPQPTSVSILAYTKRQSHFAPPSRMLGLSAYYDRGNTDGQQIIGLHSPAYGGIRAFRRAQWSYHDEVVYKESAKRPSDFVQTNTFVRYARDILNLRHTPHS